MMAAPVTMAPQTGIMGTMQMAAPITTIQSQMVQPQEVIEYVSVPKIETRVETIIKEVPQVQVVEKIVEVPEVQIQEKIVELPVQLMQEKVVEVPRVAMADLKKQTARIEVQ